MTGVAQRRARAIAFSSIAAWASFGVALEAVHALKLSTYLDDPLTRHLLVLAHAHGVGTALVLAAATFTDGREAAAPGFGSALRAVTAGTICIPLGFGLGAVAHPEGDPSIAIGLVPLGAAALIFGLARRAAIAWRPPPADE